MAKLVLSLNGAVQGEFLLNKERMTIGRKPDNDIQIDNLAVSGKHALIITILDDSFLEDLGSTNGTYVNGKLIKKHALRDGDVVGIGKHELKYVNEHATADDEEFEKTMIIRPGSASAAVAAAKAAEEAGVAAQKQEPPPAARPGPTMAPAAAAAHQPAPAPAASGMPLGRLRVLNGPIAGKELELSKALITLGKPGVQVAVISRRPQGYFLTHIEGDGKNNNFPIVNGSAIGPQAYTLRSGDIVELAGIKMEFSLTR
ncbi:MAG: FHA domain-containing protein [Gammaproteobacteria bacterium]|nr:FHA domain-containing protein [Gammaproteobacteria bacterium]MBI5615375.1 FHA domain-containing protein [Gammaproteobacteria bacterium]